MLKVERCAGADDPMADIMSVLLPPAASERLAAAGQTDSAAQSSDKVLPASAAVSEGSIAEPFDAATEAFVHLLGGLQPGSSLTSAGLVGGVKQDGRLQVALPGGSLKRHTYNPMQAAQPAKSPDSF